MRDLFQATFLFYRQINMSYHKRDIIIIIIIIIIFDIIVIVIIMEWFNVLFVWQESGTVCCMDCQGLLLLLM